LWVEHDVLHKPGFDFGLNLGWISFLKLLISFVKKETVQHCCKNDAFSQPGSGGGVFFLRDIFLNTGQCFFLKCVHFLCGSLKDYRNVQNVSLILVAHSEEKASDKRSIQIMEIGSLCPVNNS